jgi:fumarylpyruvate hydrolase
MDFVFEPEASTTLAVHDSLKRFPVRRIYCVGRNYSEHVKEMVATMGGEAGKQRTDEPPCFFTKPANAIVTDGKAAHYPTRTQDLHHEIELVVAIGKGGANIAVPDAWDHIFGFATGLDLTRRDLQTASKKAGQPWDTGKAFDDSAPVSEIHTIDQTGRVESGRIWLQVNGEMRQQADISDMTWGIPEVIAELSTLFTLAPGDLVFTGTPAGVAAIQRGDVLEGGVDGVSRLRVEIV